MSLVDKKSMLDRNVKGEEGNPVGQNPPSAGDFFTDNGNSNSPFDNTDHLKALLENSIVTGGTYDTLAGQNTYDPSSFIGNLPAPDDAIDTYPDLTNAEGFAGPLFQRSKDVASQAHVSSLGLVPGFDSNSPFQDRPDASDTVTPIKYEDIGPHMNS